MPRSGKHRLVKRDNRFIQSLPRFNAGLGYPSPVAWVNAPTLHPSMAYAGGWAYHVKHALDMVWIAVFQAHSNQHRILKGRMGRLFVRICWFHLAVLSLQSAWGRLAQLMATCLRDPNCRDPKCRKPGKPCPLSEERDVTPARVLRCLEFRKLASPAEESFRAFLRDPKTKAVNKLANQLKHGEAVAWEGFEPVLVPDVRPSPNGKWDIFTMHRRQSRDLHKEIREVVRVYAAFIPVAESVIREYAIGG